MPDFEQTLDEIQTELAEARKQIKELTDLHVVHMEYHRQQSERLENVENRVVALIKWMEPEGFTVSEKPPSKVK